MFLLSINEVFGPSGPQKPLLTQYFTEAFDYVSGICVLLEEEGSLCHGLGVVRYCAGQSINSTTIKIYINA